MQTKKEKTLLISKFLMFIIFCFIILSGYYMKKKKSGTKNYMKIQSIIRKKNKIQQQKYLNSVYINNPEVFSIWFPIFYFLIHFFLPNNSL
jgi:hypothetical protein